MQGEEVTNWLHFCWWPRSECPVVRTGDREHYSTRCTNMEPTEAVRTETRPARAVLTNFHLLPHFNFHFKQMNATVRDIIRT